MHMFLIAGSRITTRRLNLSPPKANPFYRSLKAFTQGFKDLFYFLVFFLVGKFGFLSEDTGFSMNLIAKTASPGPGVSVPTQGSSKFVELS